MLDNIVWECNTREEAVYDLCLFVLASSFKSFNFSMPDNIVWA